MVGKMISKLFYQEFFQDILGNLGLPSLVKLSLVTLD